MPSECGSRSPSWHVAQTHPQAETWAAQCLAQQGFVAYLPMCTIVRQDRRLMRRPLVPVEVPLWPRYLLVQWGPDDAWGAVQHTRGVSRLLMAQPGIPGLVADGLVAGLQATEDARRCLFGAAEGQNRSRWPPGAAVRLSDGAFAGHAAVVVRDEGETCVVALPCFGAMREVIVATGLLMARIEN